MGIVLTCISFVQLIGLTILLIVATSILPNGSLKSWARSLGSTALFIMFLVSLFVPSLCTSHL